MYENRHNDISNNLQAKIYGKITSNVIQCDLSETTNRNQEF